MIKGRSPFPFDTICLAASFSPGLPLLVKETKRLCDLHGSAAIIVHVGKKTSEKQRELAQLLSINGFNDTNSRIFWEPTDTVASILRICKQEVVDLLITGASERSELNLPVGRTASELSTKAKCSVLVYTGKHSTTFQNLVIIGKEHKKTELTLLTSLYFAEKEKSSILNIVDEAEVEYSGNGDTVERTKTRSLVIDEAVEVAKIKLNYVSLLRENANSVSDYAFKNNADLIITYSSDHHLLIFDRITSRSGIESLLKATPCSLLIIHSRIIE